MYPPSVRIKQKFVRPFVKNRISAPFLSQAFFPSICDWVVTEKKQFSKSELEELKRSSVIYCRSDLLIWFLREFSSLLRDKTIVSGGSDEEFFEKLEEFNAVRRLFLQNSHVSDSNQVFTLPIGIEDISLGLNGFPSLFKPRKVGGLSKLLVGPLSPTHVVRAQMLEELASSEVIHLQKKLITPSKYSRLARKYAAIACPRGNGEDTHRLWETLYRNTYPILLENNWSLSLKIYELPIFFVKEWNQREMERVLKEENFSEFDSKKLLPLWSDYWRKLIRTQN